MSLEQLRDTFGNKYIDDNGSYKKSKFGDKLGNNDDLKDYFINVMGRSESDWNDDVNKAGDVDTAIRSLYDGGGQETIETPTERPQFEHSPKVAHAKARLAQHEEDVWSGKTGTDLFGDTASNDPADSFLERYKIKLGEKLDNGNYLEPEQ